jgi:hypothetical protein
VKQNRLGLQQFRVSYAGSKRLLLIVIVFSLTTEKAALCSLSVEGKKRFC